eukprot:TRINITY_DN7501_c0_g1_i1.p1 TRINITY_DN7501_c0_g1~~TRINITY_DN7501_c0_g1_i1.p1  ORF type:complete len:457 (+),score=11.91 TRINITY_DN7501_c0_g1_i1:67-1437(+)
MGYADSVKAPSAVTSRAHLVHVQDGQAEFQEVRRKIGFKAPGARRHKPQIRRPSSSANDNRRSERAVGCRYQAQLLRAHARTIFDVDTDDGSGPPRGGLTPQPQPQPQPSGACRVQYLSSHPTPPITGTDGTVGFPYPGAGSPAIAATTSPLSVPAHPVLSPPEPQVQTGRGKGAGREIDPVYRRRYNMSYALSVLFRILQDPAVEEKYAHYGMWDCFHSVLHEVYACDGDADAFADVTPVSNARVVSMTLGQKDTYRKTHPDAPCALRDPSSSRPHSNAAVEAVVNRIPRRLGSVALRMTFGAWRGYTVRAKQARLRHQGTGALLPRPSRSNPLSTPDSAAATPRTGPRRAQTMRALDWSVRRGRASVTDVDVLDTEEEVMTSVALQPQSTLPISPYSLLPTASDGKASAYLNRRPSPCAPLPTVAGPDALQYCKPGELSPRERGQRTRSAASHR